MPNDYEDMEQESRLFPWIDDPGQEWDVEIEDEDWNSDLYYDTMYDDGQPDELTEWNDFDPDC